MEDARTHLSTRTFSLHKQRVVHSYNGVAVEQTDITVEEDHVQPHWRTISLEGEQLSWIDSVLSEQVTVGGDKLTLQEYLLRCSGTGRPCGYPQFVMNLM